MQTQLHSFYLRLRGMQTQLHYKHNFVFAETQRRSPSSGHQCCKAWAGGPNIFAQERGAVRAGAVLSKMVTDFLVRMHVVRGVVLASRSHGLAQEGADTAATHCRATHTGCTFVEAQLVRARREVRERSSCHSLTPSVLASRFHGPAQEAAKRTKLAPCRATHRLHVRRSAATATATGP